MSLKRLTLGAAIGLALTFAACAAPSPTVPSPAIPPLAPVTALAIEGLPAAFTYGQSTPLKATVTLDNGARKQTIDAAWQSSDKSVASVSDTGLLVVTGFGDADVTATLQNQKATAHVTLPKPPPPVARLDVTIDNHGSTRALIETNEIAFDMSQSSGFALRYDLVFGDGSISSGPPIAKHVYHLPREYTVQATVTDVLGRTNTVGHRFRVVSLTGMNGYWNTTIYQRVRILKFLDPNGSQVRGYFSDYPDPTNFNSVEGGAFTGTVSPSNDIHLVVEGGIITLDGASIREDLDGNTRLLLTIRGGSGPGTADFRYGESY